MTDRLAQQFAFLSEADKLKSVLRGTTLCDGSRPENSGEHSWHIALYALVMSEHAERPVNIDRVIKMLLLHDLDHRWRPSRLAILGGQLSSHREVESQRQVGR